MHSSKFASSFRLSRRTSTTSKTLSQFAMTHNLHTSEAVKLIPKTNLMHLKQHKSNVIIDAPKFKDDQYITAGYVDKLKAYLKEERELPKSDVVRILVAAYSYFKSLPNIYQIKMPPDGKVCVVGDTHGQYYDLLNILNLIGFPDSKDNINNDCESTSVDNISPSISKNLTIQTSIVFNGDFVDRGYYSFEVAITVIALSLCYPNNIFLIRGNHETMEMHLHYGFFHEIMRKYDREVYDLFLSVFNAMPICGVIAEKVFVTHGGIGYKDISLAYIENIDRFASDITDPVMLALLWSDPSRKAGLTRSPRGGAACKFGPDITENFLSKHNLELIVRSHEVRFRGHSIEHDGKCRTVFSAPNYMDNFGNMGAFLTFKSSGNLTAPEVTEFKAVTNPNFERNKILNI